MILAVDDVMKLPEFAVQNEKVIEEKLNAAELMIRAYTNNNFQNRFVRFTADSLGNRLLRTSDFLKVGDTVQISQSMVNDGLYTITEIGDDFIRVNQELYKSTNLITKVEYPTDIRAGVLELLKWDIKNRPKTGVKSETLSRYSATYFDQDANNQVMGYPVALLGFLKPYIKAVINKSLTSRVQEISNTASKAVETIPVPSAIVKQAVDQATALITAATHGHVVTTANEQLIMDTNDVNTARKVWRWNLNGLGYSSTGYNGTYKTAITMDGQIVGERLVGGSVSAEKLDITYRNQVIKEIADAEESARSDAEDYTDGELKKYYTKSEVETSIKNTKDSILLSAKETAEQYVDGKLKNYSTSAQIKVKTDSIESEVKKKLNSSELQQLTMSYSH